MNEGPQTATIEILTCCGCQHLGGFRSDPFCGLKRKVIDRIDFSMKDLPVPMPEWCPILQKKLNDEERRIIGQVSQTYDMEGNLVPLPDRYIKPQGTYYCVPEPPDPQA